MTSAASGFTDPPDHTRLRRLLTPEFTMRRLERLRPGIQAIVDRQIAEIAAAGERRRTTVDLVPDLRVPDPVPGDLRRARPARREARDLQQAGHRPVRRHPGRCRARSAPSAGSREFLLAEAARQRSNPGPGLIGQMIREHGDEITDFELGGLADGVFTGGLETSASMLALGTAVLLEDRELWDRLIADPDAARARSSTSCCGCSSVVQVAFPRFAKHDVVVGGQQIPQGVGGRVLVAGRQPRPPGRPGRRGRPRPTPPARTWRSATASTAASGPSWPGWSCKLAFPRRWPDASRRCGSRSPPRTSTTAR